MEAVGSVSRQYSERALTVNTQIPLIYLTIDRRLRNNVSYGVELGADCLRIRESPVVQWRRYSRQ